MSKVQEVSSTIEIIRYEGTRILEEDVALDNSAEEYIDWFCNGCPDSDTEYSPDSFYLSNQRFDYILY